MRAIVFMAFALLLAGCAEAPRPGRVDHAVIPNVVGMNLDAAEETLEGVGIGYDAETYDGDTPLVEHFWEVCSQDPPVGTRERFVRLYVGRDCD